MADIDIYDGKKIFFHMHTIKNGNYSTFTTFSFKTLRFVYVATGSIKWQINKNDYIVHRGDIVLLSNTDIRRFVSLVDCDSVEMEVYEFLPTAVGSSYHCLDVYFKRLSGQSPVISSACEGYEPINRALDDIRRALSIRDTYTVELIKSRLICFLILLSRESTANYKTGVDTFQKLLSYSSSTAKAVSLASDYINNHYIENISIDQLAGLSMLSKSHLSRAFKLYNGMSIVEYIHRIRIENTIALLAKNDINIIDAAFECGFRSSAAFYKAFTDICGMPPKEYLKFFAR